VRTWILTTLPALLLLCHTTSADEISMKTAHDLYQVCTGNSDDQVYCKGMMRGMSQMIYSAGPTSPFGICFGERPGSAEQVLTAFKNWHDTHPGLWNYSFSTGVIRALSETWPCKEK
jgi:Rap1a immunity proteins